MFLSLSGLAPVGGLDGEAAMRCCKANYALYVMINMPALGKRGEAARRCNSASYAVTTEIPRNKELDTLRMYGIIIFTQRLTVSRGVNVRQGSQTGCPAAARNVKPTFPRSYRPPVCQEQLLRCPRSRPGQVRDAAPGAERESLGERRGDRRSISYLTWTRSRASKKLFL